MILVVDNYDSFAYNLVQYVAEAVGDDGGEALADDSGGAVADDMVGAGGDVADDRAGAGAAPTDDTDGGGEALADDTDDPGEAAGGGRPTPTAGRDEPFDGVVVRRNDAVTVGDVRAMDPDGIVVSPGPGTPEEAGISVDLFAETDYPILGVCLGHQALCAAAGAPVERAPAVVHGKPSLVHHDGEGVFAGLPDPFRAGRYHSLAVERGDLPPTLVETARTGDGEEDPDAEVLMGVRHTEKPHVGVQFHPESILTGPPGGREDGTAASLAVGKRMIANFLETCSTT